MPTEYGQSAEYSLNDALWACSNVFAAVTTKVASRRILLFTNTDRPHANNLDIEVWLAPAGFYCSLLTAPLPRLCNTPNSAKL